MHKRGLILLLFYCTIHTLVDKVHKPYFDPKNFNILYNYSIMQ